MLCSTIAVVQCCIPKGLIAKKRAKYKRCKICHPPFPYKLCVKSGAHLRREISQLRMPQDAVNAGVLSHAKASCGERIASRAAMDTSLNRFDSSFNASFGKFRAKFSARKQLAYRQLFLNSSGWDLTVTSCFFFSKVESPLFCC